MWKFIANAKRALWEFVELAFLTVLALMLIFLLLGKSAGSYVELVADNVTKFSAGASSGLLGIVIVLAIIYLALRRMKQDERSRAPRAAAGQALGRLIGRRQHHRGERAGRRHPGDDDAGRRLSAPHDDEPGNRRGDAGDHRRRIGDDEP